MQWTDRIGRRLKLRDLHILLTVVQCGSMAKAARLLSVSHPVVSKAIADLEHTLNVRLVDRTAQGIEPTLFGRALLKGSISAFDDLKQTVKEIEFLADPAMGELSVGASEPVAAGLLPAVIAKLSQKYSQLTFQIEQGDALTLQRRELRERKVELVVARIPGPVPEPDMQAEVLFYERLFVVAGPQSKWIGRRKIALNELADEPWILSPLETMPGSPVVEAFRGVGLALPKARVLGYSLPLRTSLLASGTFLTVVPGSVLRFGANHSLRTLPVELPAWRSPVALVTLKNRALSPTVQLFIDAARDVARSLMKVRTRRAS